MFLLKRRGYFYVQYFDESENRTRRISTGATRQRDALKFLVELKERIAGPPLTNVKSLSAFANEYVGYLSQTHSANYIRDTEAAFRKLCEFTGDIPLQELSPLKLETFLAASFKRAQFETARNYRTLKAAFNHAVERNYLSDNPLRKIKLPRIPKSIPAFITEIGLSSIIKETKNETLKDIFLFGFNTGMRLSEMLNLRRTAVNLSERIVKVANTETFMTKDKKERIIPLNNIFLAMLARRKPKVLSIERNDPFSFALCSKIICIRNCYCQIRDI
jgi:site-specific recombinase XerD